MPEKLKAVKRELLNQFIPKKVKKITPVFEGEKIVNEINYLPIEESLQIDATHIKNLPKIEESGLKQKGITISKIIAGKNIKIDNPNIIYPEISVPLAGEDTDIQINNKGVLGSIPQSTFRKAGKLKIEDVKNLRQELDEIRALSSRVLGNVGFSAVDLDIHMINWTVLATGDGITTQFTLPQTPYPTESLEIKVGSGDLFEGATEDWTLSGLIVTFLNAPPNGAKIRYKCRV